MNNSKWLRKTVIAAMFATLTCVFTMFLKIPIVGGQGYIHLGDMVIYLAASLLPLPYACAAAGIGGALADVFGGYPIWAPATLIIKALLVIPFTSKKEKILGARNFTATAICIAITVVGYYLAEWIIYGSAVAPVASIPWNIAQAVGSALLYIVLGFALDKMNFKKHAEI